jgi:3,4-dihydroxy 2-butanone 4-phosphate synthase / GTP cyclohydrolase II
MTSGMRTMPVGDERDLLERVSRAFEEIRAGRPIILVDDEERENEGDLMMAADKVTPDAVNFMAMHGRGLICLAMSEELVDRLHLPMMQAPGHSGPPLGTAFTVSIEAKAGVTTGISAADRAHTIRMAVREDAKPEDFVSPGHVFPLKARRGGVLVRTGQTEGSVDLARLSGCAAAGVICEIMNDDGTMARSPDLERFAEKHGLCILTIDDVIQYRMRTERLVRRVAEKDIVLDATGTRWKAMVYEVRTEPRQFLALVKGDIGGPEPVLTRVHVGSTLGDVFSSTASDGGKRLRAALVAIEKAGRGVCLYICPIRDVLTELETHSVPGGVQAEAEIHAVSGGNSVMYEHGLGAQVLADLGLHKISLLTNNPRKFPNLAGFGLEVVGRTAVDSKNPGQDGR